ncbi:UDP-N-acetylglucosamine 4-epimerase, partial [Candidatus Hakubella thermalkaliphila]
LSYQGPSDLFNIGTGETASLLKLISTLEEILGREIPTDFEKAEAHVVRRLLGDVKKAKQVLSWQAKVSLREGLKETVRWFKEEYG